MTRTGVNLKSSSNKSSTIESVFILSSVRPLKNRAVTNVPKEGKGLIEGGEALSKSGPMASCQDEYDEAEMIAEPLEPAGQIQFSLEYDFYASTLILRIIQGRDLPAKDIIGSSSHQLLTDPAMARTVPPTRKYSLV
ncbi:hypothetical protein CEXT_193981 [Caerostris extrusa]|uniref:Uncharacterized protein n=1 Tax=Caerostris extrusa TaxID=172846 RepID=A0AAV4Q7L9_CAEEX|nr:hypothetical protein CEXT_193981 [Caerostris extrusa]